MPRTLNDKIYSDRRLNCSCGKHLFDVRADAQILVSSDGLILFGFAAWQCSCGKNGRFLSPTLPDVEPTIDSEFPDTKMLESRVKGITRLAFDRYRVRIRADGKEKYIGVYESEEKAINARDAAMAENLGYIKKDRAYIRQC